jgi:hypothetical protein
MRGTLQGHPAAGMAWGLAGNGGRALGTVLPADWRSCCSMAEGGVHCWALAGHLLPLAATQCHSMPLNANPWPLPAHPQLLAICIDHTKERSSHRHKACQPDDWGHLGAERARHPPRFNLLDTCPGRELLPLAAAVIVIRHLAHKKLVMLMFPRGAFCK